MPVIFYRLKEQQIFKSVNGSAVIPGNQTARGKQP